jgi:hypothetical protein
MSKTTRRPLNFRAPTEQLPGRNTNLGDHNGTRHSSSAANSSRDKDRAQDQMNEYGNPAQSEEAL